jgi:hypothetical protein
MTRWKSARWLRRREVKKEGAGHDTEIENNQSL